MRAATQERLKMAQNALATGHLVFIRLASSGREVSITSIGTTQHNIVATLDEHGGNRMAIDPEELVGIRVVEYQ